MEVIHQATMLIAGIGFETYVEWGPLRRHGDLANTSFDGGLENVDLRGTSADIITVCTYGAGMGLSWACTRGQPLSREERLHERGQVV